MEIVTLAVSGSFLVIAIVIFFIPKGKKNLTEAENQTLKIDLAVAKERFQNSQSEFEKVDIERKDLIEQLHFERRQNIQAQEVLKAQKEKLTEQKDYLDKLQDKFKLEFESIANQILKQKTHEFTEVNRLNLDNLLLPLKENIKAFEEKVDKVYKDESAERNVLKGEISKLIELNKEISLEAHNLTKALKADTKKQGNWGEVVLERVLEASGLIEGESYQKQGSHTDADGKRLQPDIIINLPDKKHIIIDSKVSLIAYERLVNCEIDDDRKAHLNSHLTSIRTHITGLSAKNYHDLYSINSPDFVLLFVPIESSFAIAIQNDLQLFDFAWAKKVVLVTPSTLLATLRTIASIWKHEQQTRNAIEIASKAGALYDKFVGFLNDIKRIGESLDKAKETYNNSFEKLSMGSGNLIGRVEHLRKLGAKANKRIEAKYLEDEDI